MTTPNVPWSVDQYVIDTEDKVVYLQGSFMRSMALHHRKDDPVPGYEVKLVAGDTMEKLKADPEYLTELKRIIKERKDAEEE